MEAQGYTDAETARIAEWVALGLSYSEIAANLPGRTASGVWHKIHKMGLCAKRKKRDAGRNQRDYLRRLLRQSDEDAPNDNIKQDEAFQRALKKAIADGLEHVEEGVSLTPCTENPVLVRPQAVLFSRSPSLMCFELGDNTREIFA